jgi:signal transduction histidine kinase
MLALVEQVLQRFPLVRIVGHMNFPDAPRKTWDDWTSYEARLNPVLSKQAGAVVCAYETSKCDGRQVMDLLRTDPVVIIGGSARSNPFFAPPDEFLVALRDRVASGAESPTEPADRERSFDPSEQMCNMERLLAIAGHDLRNPLGAVMMGALALEHEPGIPPEVLHTASRILVSAKRMSRIIEDLLEVCSARLSVGMEMKLEPTDGHELCARILEELKLGHPGREIRLRAEGNGSGCWDPDRLEQVVSNLVGNALQYGPEDAPVTIESRGSETEWTLSVHNLGTPISPEVLRNLFEPFRRGRDGSSGGIPHLGIGLFIVRRIVQAHRGTVDVTSGVDGTRFVVRLPES